MTSRGLVAARYGCASGCLQSCRSGVTLRFAREPIRAVEFNREAPRWGQLYRGGGEGWAGAGRWWLLAGHASCCVVARLERLVLIRGQGRSCFSFCSFVVMLPGALVARLMPFSRRARPCLPVAPCETIALDDAFRTEDALALVLPTGSASLTGRGCCH